MSFSGMDIRINQQTTTPNSFLHTCCKHLQTEHQPPSPEMGFPLMHACCHFKRPVWHVHGCQESISVILALSYQNNFSFKYNPSALKYWNWHNVSLKPSTKKAHWSKCPFSRVWLPKQNAWNIWTDIECTYKFNINAFYSEQKGENIWMHYKKVNLTLINIYHYYHCLMRYLT